MTVETLFSASEVKTSASTSVCSSHGRRGQGPKLKGDAAISHRRRASASSVGQILLVVRNTKQFCLASEYIW